jgi:hypothetical protein
MNENIEKETYIMQTIMEQNYFKLKNNTTNHPTD